MIPRGVFVVTPSDVFGLGGAGLLFIAALFFIVRGWIRRKLKALRQRWRR